MRIILIKYLQYRDKRMPDKSNDTINRKQRQIEREGCMYVVM